jgi:hypothetical protein
MSTEDQSSRALPPEACRDEAALRRFVTERISVNAWPIQSSSLQRLIRERGVDLDEGERFEMSLDEMERMMRRLYERSRRIERILGIDNAFHTVLHNYEVFLRLLLLEWPAGQPMPESIRSAPMRIYPTLDSICGVLLTALGMLLEKGVRSSVLARDLLAALGHDFGHSGGTDRADKDGVPAPLTHEEAAEKHVAKVAIEHGYPTALILESMAGIRATTFYSRPGRERVEPSNTFERKLTLADVMGCVLPSDLWLTHVGVPVLKEKIPTWKRRLSAIAGEIARVREGLTALPEDDPARAAREEDYKHLLAEDARIIRDIEEWFRSERGFFVFIEAHKLAPVAGARELWGGIIRDKIALMDRVLERKDLLGPLSARGFAFLEEYAYALANAGSLREWLARRDVDPRLREILNVFVAAEGSAAT